MAAQSQCIFLFSSQPSISYVNYFCYNAKIAHHRYIWQINMLPFINFPFPWMRHPPKVNRSYPPLVSVLSVAVPPFSSLGRLGSSDWCCQQWQGQKAAKIVISWIIHCRVNIPIKCRIELTEMQCCEPLQGQAIWYCSNSDDAEVIMREPFMYQHLYVHDWYLCPGHYSISLSYWIFYVWILSLLCQTTGKYGPSTLLHSPLMNEYLAIATHTYIYIYIYIYGHCALIAAWLNTSHTFWYGVWLNRFVMEKTEICSEKLCTVHNTHGGLYWYLKHVLCSSRPFHPPTAAPSGVLTAESPGSLSWLYSPTCGPPWSVAGHLHWASLLS